MAKTEKISSELFNWNTPYLWPTKVINGKITRLSGTQKKTQGEEETINQFKEQYTTPLKEALKSGNKQEVWSVVYEILVTWGGTYQNKNKNRPNKKTKEAIDFFTDQIISLSLYVDKKILDYNEITEEKNKDIVENIVKMQGKRGIASWSKILASYEPGIFFIYDSRVASALCKCADDYAWIVPQARNGRYVNVLNIPTCYFKYLQQLKAWVPVFRNNYLEEEFRTIREAYKKAGFSEDQAIMAHLEKMMFMMGGEILKTTKEEEWTIS